MTTNTLVTLVALLITSANASLSFGIERVWQREYDAMVNGQLMANAYWGGDEYIWPRHTFVDIDNDSDLDLFIGKGGPWRDESGTISFYRNVGNATCPEWLLETEDYNSIDVGANAAPTFCDIDADGDFDLFVGNGYAGCSGGTIAFYRNIGTAESAAWLLETDSLASIDVCDQSVPTFADIDGDDDVDMFIGKRNGSIRFYRNIGDPSSPHWYLENEVYGGIDVSNNRAAPTFADIDNDGDLDLFISVSNGIAYYKNIGTTQNASWRLVDHVYGSIKVGGLYSQAFGDMDMDGDIDLIIGDRSGRLHFYRNDGDKSSAAFTLVTDQLESVDLGTNSAPALVDIDSDGDLDLFVGEQDGGINFWRNITSLLSGYKQNNIRNLREALF